MADITPDLCDNYPDQVRVLTFPLGSHQFRNYGGRAAFGGEIVTIKCFEDNSLVKQYANEPGCGKVMVVDGGASLRRALLGDMIAAAAVKNGWAGIVIYGAIRDVETISTLDLGVQALGSIPLKTEKRGLGDYGVTLAFGGVTLAPGEYLYADGNGIVISAEPLSL